MRSQQGNNQLEDSPSSGVIGNLKQSSSDPSNGSYTHQFVGRIQRDCESFSHWYWRLWLTFKRTWKIREPSPVVIEFCAGWCGPSQKMNPIFDKCSEFLQYDGLSFYRVDIDYQPTIVQAANVQKVRTSLLWTLAECWLTRVLFRSHCSWCSSKERDLDLLKELIIVLWL